MTRFSLHRLWGRENRAGAGEGHPLPGTDDAAC